MKSTTALDSAAMFARVSGQRRKRPAWLLPLAMAAAVAVLAAVSVLVLIFHQAPPTEGPETLVPQSETAPVEQGAAPPPKQTAATSSTGMSGSATAAPQLPAKENGQGTATVAPSAAPVEPGDRIAAPAQAKAAGSSTSMSLTSTAVPPLAAPRPPVRENRSSADGAATAVSIGRLRTILELIDPPRLGEPDPL